MYQLYNCVWEITLACCFSCKYCGSQGGKARDNELTTEECLSVADQLGSLGCGRVSLIGGEVFMRKDWDIIAKALTSRGIQTAIITNGFQMSESIIKKLLECNIESVAVSLDGPEEIHDRFRQAGSYARAVAAIKTLAAAGIPVSVISTLNALNAQCIEDFYSFLKGLPIFAWQIQSCSPMGNAAKSGIDYRFDTKRIIDFVYENVWTAPFAIGLADCIGYYTKEEMFIRGTLTGDNKFPGCSAGITSIGIDSIGNVRGCESQYDDKFIEGNLRTTSLKSIWDNPNSFSYNRNFSADMLEGKCKGCPHGEYCRGGCRSHNYFVHGKLYEAPFCCNDYRNA